MGRCTRSGGCTRACACLCVVFFSHKHKAHHTPITNHTATTTTINYTNAVNVYLPKDRVTNAHQGYGFVEFRGEEDADYVRSDEGGREAAGIDGGRRVGAAARWSSVWRSSLQQQQQPWQQVAPKKTPRPPLSPPNLPPSYLLQPKPTFMQQCIKILNMVKMHGKPLRVSKSSQDRNVDEVGANLFVGNLDPDVDEKVCPRAAECGD